MKTFRVEIDPENYSQLISILKNYAVTAQQGVVICAWHGFFVEEKCYLVVSIDKQENLPKGLCFQELNIL
jgi:hypothetical protein